MDSVKHQVTALNDKVESLCEMVVQLNIKLETVLSEVKRTPTAQTDPSSSILSEVRHSYQISSRLDAALAHKDILVDASYLESTSGNREKELSPEIQIQRLTAQLTAAYNRIAALEEQLLAKRVHY